jgi:hypothetical protein
MQPPNLDDAALLYVIDLIHKMTFREISGFVTMVMTLGIALLGLIFGQYFKYRKKQRSRI